MRFLLKTGTLHTSKNIKSSKDTAIRHVTELVLEFGILFGDSPRLDGFKCIPEDRPEVAEFELDRRTYSFRLHYELTPSLHALPTLTPPGEEAPLLVVPNLTQAVLTACRQAQVSAADLNGRLFLRAPGLLVELPALNGRRFRFDLEPRNVFVGKSARIVRALLADPERMWKQSDLVHRTGATSGLVSRIVTYLVRQGMVARSGSGKRLQVFQLTSRDALLDAWAQADQFARRVTTHRFHCLDQDPVQLASKLSQALTQQGAPFAFTQWIAAWIRHPYTEPPLASLYVPQLPAPDVLNSLGLRAVAEGGRVWFHLPVDEGVFRETRLVENLPLVSDAQIYLDLQNTGLRGPEQARALRESSVFCRP